MTLDAIVVGAGLSGLVCAQALVEGGARVLVLEGRDRVGGRLHTGTLAGAAIDLGGQWMSVGQPRLRALAGVLGVASYPQRRDGRAVVAEPPAGRLARLRDAWGTWRAARRITAMTLSLPREGSPEAAQLDAIRLDAWLARTIKSAAARARIVTHAELVFAAEPAELSLREYLERLAVTGVFAPSGPDLPGGAREHRFAGGAQELALRLAEGLDVRLGSAVTAIDDRVRTATGDHEAPHVVLALPPLAAQRIAVELSPATRHHVDTARHGHVVKCFAAYDRAFWRDAGCSGEIYAPSGLVRAAVDASRADGPAILLAFVVGAAARAFREREPAQRRAQVLADLAMHLGDAAAHPVDYAESDWEDGCVSLAPTSTHWRAPFGRIHIAGTESAAQWPGYMEGAIEAGERAAVEILKAR